MNMNDEQEKITSQWITSLAISVVCCAALFLVFAGYIMDMHGKITDSAIRLELLQERQNQLVAEMDSMRRPIPVTMVAPASQNAPASAQPAPQNVMPSAATSPADNGNVPAQQGAAPMSAPPVPPVAAPGVAPAPFVAPAPAPNSTPSPTPAAKP